MKEIKNEGLIFMVLTFKALCKCTKKLILNLSVSLLSSE